MSDTTIITTADKMLDGGFSWLDDNNIQYKFDFNWPSSYIYIRFKNSKDANIFSLRWS